MSATVLKTYSRARHYTTRVGFCQDSVGNGVVELIACPTAEMIADALTKSLTFDTFIKFRDVMVRDVRSAKPMGMAGRRSTRSGLGF